jgi:hypothetical protein
MSSALRGWATVPCALGYDLLPLRGVQLVDGRAVLLLDCEAAELQRWCELSPVDAEILLQKCQFPDLFKIRQIPCVSFDFPHGEIVNLRFANQLGGSFECDVMLARVGSKRVVALVRSRSPSCNSRS